MSTFFNGSILKIALYIISWLLIGYQSIKLLGMLIYRIKIQFVLSKLPKRKTLQKKSRPAVIEEKREKNMEEGGPQLDDDSGAF
jgi:hypothetical protein